MELKKLPKTTDKSQKRIGRGYGSGKGGHTSSRGAKGDKARGKVALIFEGTKMKKSLLKRLPLGRGKGKLKSFQKRPIILNLKHLNLLPKETLVNIDNLVKAGLVEKKQAQVFGVKILGDGELKIALKVSLPCSSSAVEKIKKAGGEIIAKNAPKNQETKEEKPLKENKVTSKAKAKS
jgi:large subunit ribosomal protein L15